MDTVNTAVAELTATGKQHVPVPPTEEETPIMSRTQSPTSFAPQKSSGQGWLGQLGDRTKNQHENELWQLPEHLTDPFTGLGKRLEATLETYQYSTNPRSILDWACAQTGLDDPMSKYTRHELELGFERFSVERERHLKNLIRQLKAKGELETAKEIRRWLKIPAAVSALDKAMNQM